MSVPSREPDNAATVLWEERAKTLGAALVVEDGKRLAAEAELRQAREALADLLDSCERGDEYEIGRRMQRARSALGREGRTE